MDDTPTYEIVRELLARIEFSNGLDFVSRDDIQRLLTLLERYATN